MTALVAERTKQATQFKPLIEYFQFIVIIQNHMSWLYVELKFNGIGYGLATILLSQILGCAKEHD